MFHRIGLRVGAMIAEKEFERALIFLWNRNGNAYLQHDLGDGYEWWPQFL